MACETTGCPQNTFGDAQCYFHTKVYDRLITGYYDFEPVFDGAGRPVLDDDENQVVEYSWVRLR